MFGIYHDKFKKQHFPRLQLYSNEHFQLGSTLLIVRNSSFIPQLKLKQFLLGIDEA
jgi:hypothetical protein